MVDHNTELLFLELLHELRTAPLVVAVQVLEAVAAMTHELHKSLSAGQLLKLVAEMSLELHMVPLVGSGQLLTTPFEAVVELHTALLDVAVPALRVEEAVLADRVYRDVRYG